MSNWGPGLYSNDFALDLRSILRSLSRLPFDGERILDIARNAARDESTNLQHEEYTTFWLVVADQFQKRGIPDRSVLETALAIVDSDADIATMRALEMTESDIRKRSAKMIELRERLTNGPLRQRGPTLGKPRSFLMNVGDVFAYPVRDGKGINPYFVDYRARFGWVPNMWSAFLVVDRGRAFEYLPWYTIMTLRQELADLPTLETLRGELWAFHGAGTSSATHMKRLELKSLGNVPLDRDRLEKAFPKLPDGIEAAISDVSIANHLMSLSDSRTPYNSGLCSHIERLETASLADLREIGLKA
ncbi:MAG TPA: hypothetical protein VGK84_03290 [Candidatus Tumulicola sp.]|jgi:hypothetical protein